MTLGKSTWKIISQVPGHKAPCSHLFNFKNRLSSHALSVEPSFIEITVTVVSGGKLTINLLKRKKKKVSSFILVEVIGFWVRTQFHARKNSIWSEEIYNTVGQSTGKGWNITWPGAQLRFPEQITQVCHAHHNRNVSFQNHSTGHWHTNQCSCCSSRK